MEGNKFTNQGDAIVDSRRVLYTPSLFAKSSLIHLQEIGTITALKPHVTSFNNIDSYLFFIVLSGEGKVKYGGKTYQLGVNDCVFVNCQQQFSHETSDINFWTLKYCHFYGPTISMIYEKYLERGGQSVFHLDSVELFVKILDQIDQTAKSNDYIRDMRLNEQLSSLLTLLMAESWHRKENVRKKKSKQSVMPIKDYLDKNYAAKISLDNLSKEFYVSKNYMTRVFKEQFGMSIKDYLQVIRITHAKQLLRTTDKTAEQIGIECGFGSANYFSRVFKDIEGISPRQYREQW